MFSPLPTPSEMAHWDHVSATGFGLRPELLMENAGRAAMFALDDALAVGADEPEHFAFENTPLAMRRHGLPPPGRRRDSLAPSTPEQASHSQTALADRRVLLLAGPGNNGGDAMALARHLHDAGVEVLLLHTRARTDYTGEAAYHFDLALRDGVPARRAAEANVRDLHAFDIVVDGLLGTGLSGELRPDMLALVRMVNDLGRRAFVLALDIPSGLSGLTGRPLPEAVRADCTVTFEAAKLGLAQPEAAPFVGKLDVRRIGIPRAVRQAHPTEHMAMTAGLAALLEEPGAGMHKGTAGHVLILGGSAGLTGAPMLAAVAAMRAGAGLATIACPAGIALEVKASRPEVMLLPLGQGTQWTADLMDELAPALERFDAVVAGPGLGRSPGAAGFLRAYLDTSRIPTVFDADALTVLASEKDLLKKIKESAIVTPHPGEMARLLGLETAEVQADRSGCSRRLAQECGAVCVLKGAASLVAQAGRPLAVSPYREPNLAVAGSGDVLSGVAGRLLAGGLDAYLAACLSVLWHGHAGRVLSRDFPYRGNMPLEIAHALPQAIKELKGHAHR